MLSALLCLFDCRGNPSLLSPDCILPFSSTFIPPFFFHFFQPPTSILTLFIHVLKNSWIFLTFIFIIFTAIYEYFSPSMDIDSLNEGGLRVKFKLPWWWTNSYFEEVPKTQQELQHWGIFIFRTNRSNTEELFFGNFWQRWHLKWRRRDLITTVSKNCFSDFILIRPWKHEKKWIFVYWIFWI